MNILFKPSSSIRNAFNTFCGAVFFIITNQANAGVIDGSAHDFSNDGFSGGEICIVCHTPHNADTSVVDAPLWSHTITTQTYILYSSPTFDGASTISQPDGSSKLCLSCHDGTVSIDSFGGSFGGFEFVTGSEAVGQDGLNNDHPISFTYDTALAATDAALHDPATQTVTIGSGQFTKTGTISQVMLFSGKLQCASCHEVHNNFTAGNDLLRVTQNGSGLCKTCHNR